MLQRIVLPLIAVIALGFAIYFVEKSRRSPGVPDPLAEPSRKPPGAVLAGSGIVEPQTQNVEVGSPVPGIVQWVIGFDRLGDNIAPGEVLFRLDDRPQRAQVAVQVANLALAEAELDRLKRIPRPEEVDPVAARLAEAQVNEQDQEDQFQRAEQLYKKAAMSREEYKRYWFTYRAAVERRKAAEADLALLRSGTWEADLAVSEARVRTAQAQLEQANTELERLEVKALLEGELLQISVRPGEFVGAMPNQGLILLGNTRDLHVRVDFDEHDAPLFDPALPAEAHLRSHPQHVYPLEFVRVEPYVVPKRSLTGDNLERVDTRILQVVYRLKGGPEIEPPVYVGQQVDVFLGGAGSGAATAAPDPKRSRPGPPRS